MSRIADASLCCLNTKIALRNLCALPSNNPSTYGMLDALTSDRNTAGYRQITDATANSRCKPTDDTQYVEIEIEKPNCGEPSGCIDLCGEGVTAESPYLTLTPCVKMTAGTSIQISKEDFCNTCETPSERLANDLRRKAELLKQNICHQLAEKAYALMGNYSTGVNSVATPKHINIFNPKGFLNATSAAKISMEFCKQGCEQDPFMVGGSVVKMIEQVKRLGGVGCCPENGRDVNALNGMFIYDSKIDTTLAGLAGDNLSHLLSWSPGAMQLVRYYKNTGWFVEERELFTQTTIEIDGMIYDYTIKYDECNKVWNVGLCACFDLFCIPDEAYQPCNVGNHKLHWTVGCGEPSCDDFAC